MRRLLLTLCAAACAALPATAAADGGVKLVEAGNAKFPYRSYILTLPKRTQLDPSQVRVTENGRPVTHLSVSAAGAARNSVGTVLVIDSSNSMTGRPIASAMQAARAFAARRNRNQELALITFNRRTTIVMPFTSDGGEIASTLARTPRLSYGTHVYDAVGEALGLIERSHLRAATIVLLSDGADVGSTTSFDAAVTGLTSHHVRLFSVGIRSRAFDSRTLARLARAGNGSFSVADSAAALARIYDRLGFRLANEYLVGWASLSGPDEAVRVRASVAGQGTAVAGYRTPQLALDAHPPVQRTLVDRVIRSSISMFVLAGVLALLVGMLFHRLFARRPRSVSERLSEFVTVTRADEERRRDEVREVLRRGDESWRRWEPWRAFSEDVELAEVGVAPVRIALITLFVSLLVAFVGVVAIGGFGIVFAFVPPFLAKSFVGRRLRRIRGLFSDQLADNLEVLASALRAGHSLVGALAVVIEDAEEPSRSEFRRVLADEQLGVPLDEALGMTVRRMRSRDLDQVAVVAVLQRDAGANSAEVLDQIVENIRARQEVRRLVRVLTAQGRMAKWIVSLLPVALLLFITLVNSAYMNPLWHESVGHMFLALAAVMVITGSALIGRIVDIEV